MRGSKAILTGTDSHAALFSFILFKKMLLKLVQKKFLQHMIKEEEVEEEKSGRKGGREEWRKGKLGKGNIRKVRLCR